MFITKKHLSRRTVLRGMGVDVALPLLDAMVPAGDGVREDRGGAARSASSRSRWCTAPPAAPRSASQKNLWSPAAIGRDFDLTPSSLSPLEPFRDYLTIVSNTDVRNAEAFTLPEIGGDHFRSSAVFLTQAHPKQTEGSDVLAGTSLDQLYAQQFGQDTPIPSMQLCIENVDQAGGCAYGYSCVYTDTISWASPTEPLPMVRDPRAVFDQLFGVGATPEERAASRSADRSILDWITAEVARLRKELGAADRARLDRLPRRRPRDRAPHPEGRGAQHQRRAARAAGSADGRAGLVQRARQADVRPAGARVRRRTPRACSRSRWAATVRAASIPESGVSHRLPPASHHGEREERDHSSSRRSTGTTSSLVPYFLEKLKNTPDGDSNLLDNTLVIYGSPMGELERAQPQALPAVPRRPCRRHAQGQPAPQGRRRHADGQRDADAAARRSGSTT